MRETKMMTGPSSRFESFCQHGFREWRRVSLVAIIALGLSGLNAQAGFVNGEFEDTSGSPFNGWTTFSADAPQVGTDSGNTFAVFSQLSSTGSSVQLEQEIAIPIDAVSLTFDFFIANGSNGNSIFPDSFYSVLTVLPVGSSGQQTFSPTDLLFPGFFSTDIGSSLSPTEFLGRGVSVSTLSNSWKQVRLDFRNTTQAIPTTALLEFYLLDGDFNVDSVVFLDNVRISTAVVPEPGSMAIWSMAGVAIGFIRLKRAWFARVGRA